MASDRETLIAMFDRAGVPWHDGASPYGGPHSQHLTDAKGDKSAIRVEADDRPNDGYGGFFATFYFDAGGLLTRTEVWE